MNTQSSTIVQRVWNYCNVLRDDGISYGDYVEQLTYLLFLKMDMEHEGVKKLGKNSAIPDSLTLTFLLSKEDSANLPSPDVLMLGIVEDVKAPWHGLKRSRKSRRGEDYKGLR